MGIEVFEAHEYFVIGDQIQNDGNNERQIGNDETSSMSCDRHGAYFYWIDDDVDHDEDFE